MSPVAEISGLPPAASLSLNTLPVDQRRGMYAMWCLIATEFMLFVSMFGAYYYLGTNQNRWEHESPPHLRYALIMLIILLFSSVVLEWGKRRVEEERFGAGRAALWATVLIGVGFMAIQTLEYKDHWKALAPYSDSYGSIFYAITSLHAAHVIAGLLLLCYVGILPRYGDSRGSPHRPYQTAALYWHFVDVVWVFVVLLLYVVPHFQGGTYGH